jgi:hypothetical protein
MFERFTEAARMVLVMAQEEARILKHNYIGTEHLLLGVARVDGPAAELIAGRGLDLGALREALVRIVGMGDKPAHGQVPFTPRAKRVLEAAAREALTREQHVGPEHLLLGILKQRDGVGFRMLASRGSMPELTERVTAMIADAGPAGDVHPVESGPPAPSAIGFARPEPIGHDAYPFLHQLCQSVELLALACTGLVVTGALVAVAVLDAGGRSHAAVEAGVLAGAAFAPASMLVVVADAANRVRRVHGAGADVLPVAAMTIAAVGLGTAGIAVHAVGLTIALGAAASAVAVVAAGYALRSPSL